MADNANATAGDGSIIVATDKIGGVDYQRVKAVWGVDGTADDVSATKPLPVDLANTGANATAIKVDGSAVTQPVSIASVPSHAVTNAGTFAVQAAQSGTWTVQPGNTVNTTAWKVDGSAVTQPVSASSLPLPAAAATSTKQSDGTQKSQVVDGSGNVIGATSNALDINIKSGNPTSIATTQSGTWTVQPGNTANTTAWKVDGSAVAQPVTDNSGSLTVDNAGTFATQAAQSGTWTVQPGNTANTTAWKVDGSAVTQPGSLASGAVASGAIASGAVASGAVASGAIAAGAFAAGATSPFENEDVASGDGDRGIKVLFKRTDTPAASSGTDGDYEQPQMSGGYVWVAPPPLVKVSSAQFTRPADANTYAANDAIADSTTAGSVTKLQYAIARSGGRIVRVRVKHGMATQSPTLRLWFWDATFTVAAGDNAAFSNPLTNSIGYADVVVSNVGSDASTTIGYANCDIPFTAATVFGLLQTLTGVTSPTTGATFDTTIWYIPN